MFTNFWSSRHKTELKIFHHFFSSHFNLFWTSFWITLHTKFRIFIFVAQPPLSQFQWYEKIWFFESHRTKYLEFPYLWRSHHYHNFSEMKEYDFLNYTELKIFNKVQNKFSLKLYNQIFFQKIKGNCTFKF